MRKIFAIILAITLTLTFFASCGKPETALTSTELLDLGEKYLLDLDYEQAIVYFNQVIEVEPRNSRAYMGAAEAYVGLGDTESAISILKTALDVFSDDEAVLIELLEMLIEIDPTTAEWYLDLAQIYINQGNTDKAIEVLEQGLNNASDTTDIEALLSDISPVDAKSHWLNNDMLSEPTYFTRSEITEIDFLDTIESAPDSAWDFSLVKDGSVLGWLEETHLYVASEGGVIVDEDASHLFGSYDNVSDDKVFSSLTTIRFNDSFDTSNVKDMNGMFRNCLSLSYLDLSEFNTSNVADMHGMFNRCIELASLDLSSFDTSNVTDMGYMFGICSSIISLDVSSFDTSNVTDMNGMFFACHSLVNLDLSGFNTSKVTDMSCMFQLCLLLNSLDLSNFDTSNVTDMSQMFLNCESLTTLDVSNFDTSKVTSMRIMFEDCYSLVSLDLSSFDTPNVTSMYGMFSNCTSLTSLDISNFDMSNADTENMFGNTIWR